MSKDNTFEDADDRRQRNVLVINWGTFGLGLVVCEGWRWLTVHELHTPRWSYFAVGVGPFLFVIAERARRFP